MFPKPLSRRLSSAARAPIAKRGLNMQAHLKVDPKLRFLKLSMMAADCGSMRSFAVLLVGFFRGMNE